MKKLTIILTALFLATGVFAQEKKDTTTINLGKKTIIIINENEDNVKIMNGDTTIVINEDSLESDEHHHSKKFNGHWAGIDLGLNGYVNSDNSLSLKPSQDFLNLNQAKSWNFSLNFAEFNIGLYKKYIGITSGLGLQFNNYRFDSNVKLVGDSSYLTSYIDTIKYNKNKLVVSYLTLPLLLDFQIPLGHHDRLYITAGVVGALRIGTHTKQVFDINGNENKEKQREDFHLSPFQYSATARIGFNNLGLFANYSLSALFKDGEGPELYPWSAGLSFSF